MGCPPPRGRSATGGLGSVDAAAHVPLSSPPRSAIAAIFEDEDSAGEVAAIFLEPRRTRFIVLPLHRGVA